MSNKILSTLNIGNNSYEIDDAFARQKIAEMDNTITEMEDKIDTLRDDYQTVTESTAQATELAVEAKENADRIYTDVLKSLPIDNASGTIVSFPDGADDIPLKSLVVGIEPVQDLHGYDNSWPAGGGKNKINVPDVTLSQTGYVFNLTNLSIPAGTYTFSMDTSVTTRQPSFAVVGANGDYLNQSVAIPFTFTVDGVITGLRCYSNEGTYSKIMLEAGSEKTSYAPYSNICPISGWTGCNLTANGTEIPISWETEAGTVYGGTLDVTNGVLTVDKGFISSYNGESLPSTWISDRDVYTEDGIPTVGAEVIYILSKPVTYQLTPTEVKSTFGINNIYTDCGNVSVEYRADTTMYINRKIAEAIDALT